MSHSAEAYLLITGTAGILFGTLNQIFTGICTGRGNSKLPFVVTSAGLVLNVILDPVLIFGLGPFPELGVVGAAAATAGSQGVVTLLFLVFLLKDQGFFRELAVFRKPDSRCLERGFSSGLPAGIQNVFMSGLSLLISRIVSSFGADAIAVQRVGEGKYLLDDFRGFWHCAERLCGPEFRRKADGAGAEGLPYRPGTDGGLGRLLYAAASGLPPTNFRTFPA